MSVITLEELKNYWKNVSDWITGNQEEEIPEGEETPTPPHIPKVNVQGNVSISGVDDLGEQVPIYSSPNKSLMVAREKEHLGIVTYLDNVYLIDQAPMKTESKDLSSYKNIKWFISNTHSIDIEMKILVDLEEVSFYNPDTDTWENKKITIPANQKRLIIPNGISDGILNSGYGRRVGLEVIAKEEPIEEGFLTIEAWGEPI